MKVAQLCPAGIRFSAMTAGMLFYEREWRDAASRPKKESRKLSRLAIFLLNFRRQIGG